MITNASGIFSADVELRLVAGEKSWELGQLGPDFAILRAAQTIDLNEAIIERIVDGKKTTAKIRITSPITEQSRRFTFETTKS